MRRRCPQLPIGSVASISAVSAALASSSFALTNLAALPHGIPATIDGSVAFTTPSIISNCASENDGQCDVGEGGTCDEGTDADDCSGGLSDEEKAAIAAILAAIAGFCVLFMVCVMCGPDCLCASIRDSIGVARQCADDESEPVKESDKGAV